MAAAVLSGNRNFEGRVNADVRANYLASPPLVVAYSIAGSMQVDVAKEPLGTDQKGKKVFLKDIWPSNKEIGSFVAKNVTKQIFAKKYADVFKGDANWRKIAVKGGLTYALGQNARPTCRTRLISRAWKSAGAARGHRRRARAGAAARTRSPPTTSRRPARSRKRARPANICVDHQVKPERLQPVRHAPRQSRGDDARHLRQYPAEEPDGAGRGGRLHRPLPVEEAHDDVRRGDEVQSGRTFRSSSSAARNTAPARRATGRPRARCCSASAR